MELKIRQFRGEKQQQKTVEDGKDKTAGIWPQTFGTARP